jgi:hypothetical protein
VEDASEKGQVILELRPDAGFSQCFGGLDIRGDISRLLLPMFAQLREAIPKASTQQKMHCVSIQVLFQPHFVTVSEKVSVEIQELPLKVTLTTNHLTEGE